MHAKLPKYSYPSSPLLKFSRAFRAACPRDIRYIVVGTAGTCGGDFSAVGGGGRRGRFCYRFSFQKGASKGEGKMIPQRDFSKSPFLLLQLLFSLSTFPTPPSPYSLSITPFAKDSWTPPPPACPLPLFAMFTVCYVQNLAVGRPKTAHVESQVGGRRTFYANFSGGAE